MKIDNKSLLFIGLGVFAFLILWGLYTLQYTPVPWVDEVYFASVTQSLTEGSGLTLPIGLNENVYHYGPVYFLLTGLSVLIGGLNPISIRFVGFVFSIVSAILFYMIIKEKGVGMRISLVITLLLSFDQLFVYCSHIGRMETLALSFYLLGLLYFEKARNIISIKYIVIIAICLLLSFLTTSRTAVLILPIGIAMFIRLCKDKEWLLLASFIFIPVIGFVLWLFISYGSFEAFVNYYTTVDSGYADGNLIDRFIGGSFIISKTHYPLVLLTICVIIHGIKSHYFKDINLYLFTIILFYLVVHSSSDTYSIIILPLYYLIIGVGLFKVWKQRSANKIWSISFSVLIVLIGLINVAIFTAKWALIESSVEYRDKSIVDGWISNNIPAGSIVLGSDSYYYSFTNAHCEFKSLTQVYKNDEQFCRFMNEVYQPEFVMYNSNEASPDAIKAFKLLNLKPVSHYSPEPITNWLDTFVKMLGLQNKNSYEGDLYKVVYFDQNNNNILK
ncbi:MAG: glycosyltransferase family 39 protein [Prevotella sp.]|nr:glycosyltransferase family 39 protein [Prevotella sp.]